MQKKLLAVVVEEGAAARRGFSLFFLSWKRKDVEGKEAAAEVAVVMVVVKMM
uniref:Uncharacterized protein n=1 Tax=Rhizophora mucronata TaxID=61149 RepID=A0A2P2QWG2_RHIMU